MAVIAAALVAVADCIDDAVKGKAKEKVDELLTDIRINYYLRL
jgi:hypothetical protein